MSLIGISGKIGVGKDVVGYMIQYLTSGYRFQDPEYALLQKIIQGKRKDLFDDVWKIRKFADPLKDCVCIILGCTREQLEDRNFKEKELGEEWTLLREYSSYSSDTKIYPINYKGLIGTHTVVEGLTPRKILQLLGTEGGRETIHPEIWVNASLSNYKKDCNWVFTDVRFPNELGAIKDLGGTTIRIERGEGNTGDHASETALDNAEFDYKINNDGTLEDLFWKVRYILYNNALISTI